MTVANHINPTPTANPAGLKERMEDWHANLAKRKLQRECAAIERYRDMLESWQVVVLDRAIAEDGARLHASLRLKLADSIQLASAFAINADALVTHDRDFSRVKGLR